MSHHLLPDTNCLAQIGIVRLAFEQQMNRQA
jgi:hypothetical protein